MGKIFAPWESRDNIARRPTQQGLEAVSLTG